MASGGLLGLPGYDPTFEPAPVPSRPTALPAGFPAAGMPSPAPSAPPDGGSGLPNGVNIQQALKLILPAIAALYSAKSGGGIGGFMQGFMGGEQQQAENADRLSRRTMEQERLGLQRDSERREAGLQARAQANEERRRADLIDAQIMAKQAEKEKSIHNSLSAAIANAAKNPGFMSKVNESGAENFSLTIPGLGAVNLKEAFDKLGVVQGPDGAYNYGEAAAVIKEPELVATPAAGGGATYEPKVKGGKVYERPRQAREPKAPGANRSYTEPETDESGIPTGRRIRFTEDAAGNVIKREVIDTTAPKTPAAASPAAKPQDPLGIR